MQARNHSQVEPGTYLRFTCGRQRCITLKTSAMLLCSTVVVVLRGIDRRHSSASGPLFQPSGRTHATAAAARPGGAFLAVSWAGSLGSCDGRHGRPSLS